MRQSKEAKGSRLDMRGYQDGSNPAQDVSIEAGWAKATMQREALRPKEWGRSPCGEKEAAITACQETKQGEKGAHIGEVTAATIEDWLYIGEMIK